MVSFTEVVLLAAEKYNVTLSGKEKAKIFYKQQTVVGIKSFMINTLNDNQRQRWLARKALNNWLSCLKNVYRPRELKKKKVKVEESAANHSDEDSVEQDLSASDEEEGTDREAAADPDEESDEEENATDQDENGEQSQVEDEDTP